MDRETENLKSLRTGVEFVSEMLFPGGSNLVKGDLKQGGIHAVLGIAAKMLLGPPALLLISANSFTKAATGHHLFEHLGIRQKAEEPAPVVEAPPAAPTVEAPPAAPTAPTRSTPG